MPKQSLLSKWKHKFTEPAYPNVGIEINSDCVRLAAIGVQNGKIQIQPMDSVPLPSDAVQITPFKLNILELEPVAAALKDLWMRNRYRSQKICLLLQDRSALAFSIALESKPENREECVELIRFKLKKSIPFRIEDAQINYFQDSGISDYQSLNLWVTVLNPQILHQYEDIIRASVGSDCGLVDFSTFNLMNLAHAEIQSRSLQMEDHLYINLNRNYISLAITQKDKLVFFRSRELEHQNGALQEAMQEIHPAMMFYQDKLSGAGFARAFVYALESSEELCKSLEQTHRIRGTILNPDGSSRDTREFAPLLGMLMSRKPEFS
jgi:type IV pilus assembly protein PilM